MTTRFEPGNGSPPSRPRSLVPPPPDSAEALYYEGMAAYQHRNWEQALERFSRLKELQPARPGLDALLDEVRWFLQLQGTAPAAASATSPQLAPTDRSAEERARSGPNRWRILAVVAFALIGIVAALLFVFQGNLPWAQATDREAEEAFNRGQTRLAVGDYEGAEAAFNRLLEIKPGDPEAQFGLATAQRQKSLAQGYAAAEAAIAEEDWDTAAAELERILASDPGYSDAQAKSDFVSQRRRLAALYDDGSRLYDLAQWQDALAQFEKIQQLDITYRTEAVAEFLFVCYLNAGEAIVADADGDVATVTQAVDYFSQALAIHPRNRLAANAQRQGVLYLDVVRMLAAGNRSEAQSRLEALLAEAPDYGQGAAARQLYRLLLDDAEAALQAGDIPAAIRFYAQAQTVSGVDVNAAVQGEAIARAITPTPTPRPTATPSPTPPPQPVAVITGGPLNLRAGPGTTYAVVGQAASGARLPVTGRSADGQWLRVCVMSTGSVEPIKSAVGVTCTAETGQQGWLAASLLTVQGDLTAVAVVTPAVRPPSGATAPPRLPTATPAFLVACVAGQVRDVAGGQPLAGWTITLQRAAGPALTIRTGPDGKYLFAGLLAGSYIVSEQLEPNWRNVSPLAATVTVAPAAACVGVDFWNSSAEQAPSPTEPPR